MTLYDAYGRPVDTAQLREEQAGPTLAGVRNIYSVMHPSVGLTPEKLAAILRQAEFGDPFLYLELAEEMEEKDLHYLSVLETRKQTLAQLDLVVRPASSAKDDARAAEMLQDILFNGTLGLEDALFNILDAIGKGYSVAEIVWDTAGKQWIPQQLRWRDPRWFLFDWISGEQLLVRTLDGQSINSPPDNSGYRHLEPRFSPSQGSRNNVGWLTGIQPMTALLAPFKFIVHFAKAKAGLPIRGGLARAAA